MKGPTYNLTRNSTDSSQRNPGWCIAFVRFAQPAAMYDSNKDAGLQTKELLVIENDCISVSVNRPKNSFAKTASLTMKPGEIYYQNAVAPGDWVFIWMSDWDTDTSRIADQLRSFGLNNKLPQSLNDWNSGLKFVGRVQSVDTSDSVSSGGTRSLNQTIQCQAFLEFATSIYYTFIAQMGSDPSGKGQEQDKALTFFGNIIKNAGLSKLAEQYIKALESLTEDKLATPDRIISLLLILVLGIARDTNPFNNKASVEGTFNDAIGIPGPVATILGRGGKTKLWQLFNFYMGIQRYENNSIKTWENFCPVLQKGTSSSSVFLPSPTRCRGRVPFRYPPRWDNVNLWSVLTEVLDSPVNEIYTSLRINNQNQIVPSLTVREKPFGTNLFHAIDKSIRKLDIKPPEKKATESNPNDDADANNKNDPSEVVDKEKQEQSPTEPPPNLDALLMSDSHPADKSSRTLFENLPRWVVHEELLTNISVGTSEQARINFVQVWGRSKALEMVNASLFSPQEIMQTQMASGNFAVDLADISRNGLRADISETQFDILSEKNSTGLTPLYARLRADWLFNGHLKPAGSITTLGIKAPICEGDNVQVRGTVFHIESLSFNGSINTVTGKKSFTTTMSVSNGILAQSLTGKMVKGKPIMPMYPIHLPTGRSNQPDFQNLPGVTDVEKMYTDIPSRDNDGEAQSVAKNKKGKK